MVVGGSLGFFIAGAGSSSERCLAPNTPGGSLGFFTAGAGSSSERCLAPNTLAAGASGCGVVDDIAADDGKSSTPGSGPGTIVRSGVVFSGTVPGFTVPGGAFAPADWGAGVGLVISSAIVLTTASRRFRSTGSVTDSGIIERDSVIGLI